MTALVRKQKHWHELTKSGASIPSQKKVFLLPEDKSDSTESLQVPNDVTKMNSTNISTQ
jgi:hypothetical protein